MAIWWSANIVDIFEMIPTSEKFKMPLILKPFQPSSLALVSAGTKSVVHIKNISSSVFPTKQNSSIKLTCLISFILHAEKSDQLL